MPKQVMLEMHNVKIRMTNKVLWRYRLATLVICSLAFSLLLVAIAAPIRAAENKLSNNATARYGAELATLHAGASAEYQQIDVFSLLRPVYDLALIVTLGPGQADTVAPGATVTYVVTVKNQGLLGSGDFTVTDQIPAGMSFVSASGTGWNCDAVVGDTGALTCEFSGSLTADEVTELSVEFQIDDASQAPFQNWAEISADGALLLGLLDVDSIPDAITGEDFGPGILGVIAPNDLVNNTNEIDYDGLDDEDDNDFETVDVRSAPLAPAISLQKTVYNGQNGGGDCPGQEFLAANEGSEITYCFLVTNSGDTHLNDIAINDVSLGITEQEMALVNGTQPLAPNETLLYIYETTLDSSLVNTANATGNPTDASGSDIPDLVEPSAQDSAEVEVIMGSNPAILLETSVYAGQDAGAGCSGQELLIGTQDELITYCFVVTNTGDTHLGDITVIDVELDISRNDLTLLSGTEPLSPTESLVFYYETTLTEDLLNTAIAEGNPMTASGNEIPGLANPSYEDDAEVQLAAPAIQLEKTVYIGHDGGQTCPGREVVSDVRGTDITYCFGVTNVGNTYLDTIVLTDTALALDPADLIVITGTEPIAPNGSLIFAYETSMENDLLNTAQVSGNPADSDGNDIAGVNDPTDDDTAEVQLAEQVAAIQLAKTVYLGHDGGTNCAGEELVNGSNGADLTYCFVVTNIGETYLSDIVVNDDDLGVNQADMTLLIGTLPLAPSASIVYIYETSLAGNLINTADASGNPTDEAGNDLPGYDDPSAEDDAEVRINLASIGNIVWLDSNGDGLQNSNETGIPGIDVTLYDEDGQSVAVTESDNLGLYMFSNLEPGRYSLGFALPSSNYTFSPPNVTGANDEGDSDVDIVSGRTEVTLLATGEVDMSWDAGIVGIPQLTIEKNVDKTVVQPGGKIVYRITYANTGVGQANNVIITENIPLYTRLLPDESSAFVCANGSDAGGTLCTFDAGMIPAQGGGDLELVFVVVADTVIPENVRVIENIVSIDDGGPAGLQVDGVSVQISRPTAGEIIDEPGESFETTLYLPMIQ